MVRFWIRAMNCQKRILLLKILRGRNVFVVSLLKIIAFCVTQEGPHDPLHVDFSFLASCEQNLIIFWARQCPYGTGTETGWVLQSECTRGGGSGRLWDVSEKAENGPL